MIGVLTNHLWQSTLFAVMAGLLSVAFRKHRAQVRYWLWFSASCKFLLPFSLLISLGSRVQLAPDAGNIALPAVTLAMEQIAQPFPDTLPFVPSSPGAADWVPIAIFGVWACGFSGIALIRFRDWLRIRAAVRASSRIDIPAPVEVRSSPGLLEPGVVGLLRPILLLPEGIAEQLTPPQLASVLAHELCHIRRRDNPSAAIHMIVEAVFWFHPLVWWIGARLVEERERACDEEVLSLGSAPRDYAEGILNVCKLYMESPLTCVSGVTGADLKKRIEAIMSNRIVLRLNFARKAVLAVGGVAAIALPIAMGIVNAPFVRAQSSAGQKRLTFDVASVKPASVPSGVSLVEDGRIGVRKGSGIQIPRNTGGPGTDNPGRIHYPLISLKQLLRRAWDSYYEIDGPSWLDSQAVAVDAIMPPDTTKAQFQEMLRNLITERFGLQDHAEKKRSPVTPW